MLLTKVDDVLAKSVPQRGNVTAFCHGAVRERSLAGCRIHGQLLL